MLGSVGRHEEAIGKLEEVLEFSKDYPYAWYGLGVALVHLAKYEEAIEKFQIATRINPNLVEAWRGLAVTLTSVGRSEEAIDKFRTATDLSPTYADAWYNWGVTLDILGEHESASEKFRAARNLGCQRSLQFPGMWKTIILTAWTEDQGCRRGAVGDTYALKGYGDITGAPSWPKGIECPYYGLLVEIDAEDAIIDQIYRDERYLVILSKMYDPDNTPDPSWANSLQTWLMSHGMPPFESEEFVGANYTCRNARIC